MHVVLRLPLSDKNNGKSPAYLFDSLHMKVA
ncbi:hypothetical protein Godav_003592 [Gossypium davidsonii]|nr:hypothetical protein [Gossypium davidsonii]